MPIYEYRCDACGEKFEKLVRRTEEVLEAGCPSCGDRRLQQEYSTFAAPASSPRAAASAGPACPGGMCSNPGMCGMN